MPQSRFRLLIPEHCPQCLVQGKVKLEQTIKGEAVEVAWCCTACSHSWPVKDGEIAAVDRRGGVRDRRKATRADRRAS